MPMYRVIKTYQEQRAEVYIVEAENSKQAVVETSYNDPAKYWIESSDLLSTEVVLQVGFTPAN